MINSVIKTFQTIEYLLAEQECDLASLSKALGFPKSTALRILKTLSGIGYVDQDRATSKYRPSVKFFTWGRLMAGRAQLLEIARPFMRKLSEETGETVNLGVLDGSEVICVDKVASKQFLRQDQPIGSRALAYRTAFGKAQLAFLPEASIGKLLSRKAFEGGTGRSLRTLSALRKELKMVKNRGYAVDDEEFAHGVRCVGAPIFDDRDLVIAGISIAGPALRMAPNRTSKLAASVVETARRISKLLGWTDKNM